MILIGQLPLDLIEGREIVVRGPYFFEFSEMGQAGQMIDAVVADVDHV